MRLTYIHIQNFKSIRDMEIRDIDRALILVGKNNTGKTSVLDAVCAALGCYEVQDQDFNEQGQAVRIAVRLELSGEEGVHNLRLCLAAHASARQGGVWIDVC